MVSGHTDDEEKKELLQTEYISLKWLLKLALVAHHKNIGCKKIKVHPY